jgi:alkylhydroperoxidase family enzyme
MTWTTWIETEPEDTVNETIRELYSRTRDMTTGRPPDAVRLTSLTPTVSGLLYELQRAIYQESKGLTLREKEIAALLVSVYNGCVH